MSKISEIGHSLYEGTLSIDFVGRKWLWYALSGVIVLAAVAGLTVRGLNLGIEFEGGVEYSVAMPQGGATQVNVEKITDAVARTAGSENIEAASQPIVNTSAGNILVQTKPLTNDESQAISSAIQKAVGVGNRAISSDAVGATWGQQVANRALLGLVVFLILVVLFIWAYFREWKASVAALVALAHDLVITIGIYALSGFEVTPATVTGILTILGFSLYDTVVVFDKVRENTKNLTRTRQTYGEAANLAVNQTLVRSINTSIVALLPVGALLYVGVFSLGSGALKDLALSLFVGMAAGTYSSIFVATPLLVQLKELEPGVRAGDARARRHRDRREVDRYATVPTFRDDMPLHDQPDGFDDDETDGHDDIDDPGRARGGATAVQPGALTGGATAARPVRTPRSTAGERPASRSVSPSASSKRAQPSRKPRSQRGKG